MAKIILHVEEGSTDCWKCPFHIVDQDGSTRCGDNRLELDCASFNLETLSFVKVEEDYVMSEKNIINSLTEIGGTDVYGVKKIGLTVDEFWNKYPFKIGDLVNIPDYDSKVSIISMTWDGQTVLYETAIVVNDEPYSRVWYECEDLLEWNKH